MEETVSDISTKIRQRKKMSCTNKEEVEGSFNLTKHVNNTMHTFFYSSISEFGGNVEGMLDEGNYRKKITNNAQDWLEDTILQVCWCLNVGS